MTIEEVVDFITEEIKTKDFYGWLDYDELYGDHIFFPDVLRAHLKEKEGGK